MAIGIATMGMFRGVNCDGCTPGPVAPAEIGSGVGGIHLPPTGPKCHITVERVRFEEEETKYIKVMAIRTKNGDNDD